MLSDYMQNTKESFLSHMTNNADAALLQRRQNLAHILNVVFGLRILSFCTVCATGTLPESKNSTLSTAHSGSLSKRSNLTSSGSGASLDLTKKYRVNCVRKLPVVSMKFNASVNSVDASTERISFRADACDCALVQATLLDIRRHKV